MLETFMTDTQSTDVLTFDFKGTGVSAFLNEYLFWCRTLLSIQGL